MGPTALVALTLTFPGLVGCAIGVRASVGARDGAGAYNGDRRREHQGTP